MSTPVVSTDTLVGHLLEANPALLEVLIDAHPHFHRLRNPTIRRVLAPRVTVGQAARIAGVPAETLLARLRAALGEPPGAEPPTAAAAPLPPPSAPPAVLADLPGSRQVHLDVRADIAGWREPLARIMAAVKTLPDDATLVLRAPFEPVPLYDLLGRRGFAHWTECRARDDWRVWFYRCRPADGLRPTGAAVGGAGAAGHVRLDVRGLEPPAPMVRILDQLERLEPGQVLEVLHDRRPIFLYPQLDDRRFGHETAEEAPGLVRITIRRGPPDGISAG